MPVVFNSSKTCSAKPMTKLAVNAHQICKWLLAFFITCIFSIPCVGCWLLRSMIPGIRQAVCHAFEWIEVLLGVGNLRGSNEHRIRWFSLQIQCGLYLIVFVTCFSFLLTWITLTCSLLCCSDMQLTDIRTLTASLPLMGMDWWRQRSFLIEKINQDIEFIFSPLIKVRILSFMGVIQHCHFFCLCHLMRHWRRYVSRSDTFCLRFSLYVCLSCFHNCSSVDNKFALTSHVKLRFLNLQIFDAASNIEVWCKRVESRHNDMHMYQHLAVKFSVIDCIVLQAMTAEERELMTF